MKRFVTILSAIVLLSSVNFAQQMKSKDFEALKKVFASTLKSSGYYGNVSSQTNVSAVKFKDSGCRVDIETFTRTNYQPWRETYFRDFTEVVSPIGAYWLSKETRTMSFDLSQVDLGNILVEDGVAEGTSFIRVPMAYGFVTIRPKERSRSKVLADSFRKMKQATLVLKENAAQKAKQQLTELVSFCLSSN